MASMEDARRGVGPGRRTGPGVVPRIRRRLFQGLVAFAVVAAGTWFGVVEVRQRFTHVHETGARVAGDLVTVSSRVAGRLISAGWTGDGAWRRVDEPPASARPGRSRRASRPRPAPGR